MFDLYQLEQLVIIAKEGTLSKAAETLSISQPALTRSIQRLEEELEVQLFDRKKNKITLNDNGELAVEYAKKILHDTYQMKVELQLYDKSKQTITIGSCAPAPIWLLQYLYHKKHPDMKIFDTIESNQEKLLDGLENNQYSIIVLHEPFEHRDYICQPLFEENLYLSLPPAHPLSLFDTVNFEDLNGESVLLLSRIGFWNELCLKKIPNSHLLIQEDVSIFNEILKASALPNFKTNISMQKEPSKENRICIPITDKEAHVLYYAVYKKENRKLLTISSNEIQNIDWRNIK